MGGSKKSTVTVKVEPPPGAQQFIDWATRRAQTLPDLIFGRDVILPPAIHYPPPSAYGTGRVDVDTARKIFYDYLGRYPEPDYLANIARWSYTADQLIRDIMASDEFKQRQQMLMKQYMDQLRSRAMEGEQRYNEMIAKLLEGLFGRRGPTPEERRLVEESYNKALEEGEKQIEAWKKKQLKTVKDYTEQLGIPVSTPALNMINDKVLEAATQMHGELVKRLESAKAAALLNVDQRDRIFDLELANLISTLKNRDFGRLLAGLQLQSRDIGNILDYFAALAGRTRFSREPYGLADYAAIASLIGDIYSKMPWGKIGGVLSDIGGLLGGIL